MSILDKYDSKVTDEVAKSEDQEKPASSDAKKPEQKAKDKKEAKQEVPDKQDDSDKKSIDAGKDKEVKKDLEEDTDAPANPDDFERDDKVEQDKKDDPNGGNFKVLTQLHDDFTVCMSDLKKSMATNQESIAEVRGLTTSLSEKIEELKGLITSKQDVEKSDDSEEEAKPEEKEPVDSPDKDEDGKPSEEDKKESSKKEEPAKEEPKESPLDVAESVPDTTDYTAVAPDTENKEADDKKDKKPSLSEKFATALDLRQDFIDKLNGQAEHGTINPPAYAEKSELLRSVSLGENVDESMLDDYLDYVSK